MTTLEKAARQALDADADEESALKAIKLPCAVRIGHGTHGKGTSVWTLVLRARALYQTVVDRDQKQAEPAKGESK